LPTTVCGPVGVDAWATDLAPAPAVVEGEGAGTEAAPTAAFVGGGGPAGRAGKVTGGIKGLAYPENRAAGTPYNGFILPSGGFS